MIKNYYAENVKVEWRRLVKDAYHRLEFETTRRFPYKYLPKTGLILDAVKRYIEGSITDLSMFRDDFFDGVLCLGAIITCRR